MEKPLKSTKKEPVEDENDTVGVLRLPPLVLLCQSSLPLVNLIEKTRRHLDYAQKSADRFVHVITRPSERFPTRTGYMDFQQICGCAHPAKGDCSECGDRKYPDRAAISHPFLDVQRYRSRLNELMRFEFKSGREAKEAYTYFNSLNEWHNIIGVRDHFVKHYSCIEEAMFAIKLRYNQRHDLPAPEELHYQQKQLHHVPLIGTPDTTTTDAFLADNAESDSASASQEVPDYMAALPKLFPGKEYCSWIFAPDALSSTTHDVSEIQGARDNYTLHYIYTHPPSKPEIASYLNAAFHPPPSLAQAMLHATRRTLSQGSIIDPDTRQAKRVREFVSDRRTRSGVLKVRKQASIRSLAMLQRNIKNYEDTTPAVSMNPDERAERRKRFADNANLLHKFQTGFPTLILVADTTILEARLDYIITPHPKYINVFFLKTPVGNTRARLPALDIATVSRRLPLDDADEDSRDTTQSSPSSGSEDENVNADSESDSDTLHEMTDEDWEAIEFHIA